MRAQSFAHPAVGLARACDFSGFLNHPQTRASLTAWPYGSYMRDVGGVERNAVDRADLLTLRRVEMADALGAAVGIDDVDLRPLRDRAVRAFGLADVAVDALVGDDQGHARASF